MLDNIQIIGRVTLKQIRLMEGLTQQEFAEKLGIPYRSYRRYEKNVGKMDVDQLWDICEKLGVEIGNIKAG